MIEKNITFFGQSCVLFCDGKCHKSWGINQREKISFGDAEPDDFAYLADEELGEAPSDPGTYEGGHAKPLPNEEKLNKWCARECERSKIVDVGEAKVLSNFSQRVYNQPTKHPKQLVWLIT